jgi:hypothetical protein
MIKIKKGTEVHCYNVTMPEFCGLPRPDRLGIPKITTVCVYSQQEKDFEVLSLFGDPFDEVETYRFRVPSDLIRKYVKHTEKLNKVEEFYNLAKAFDFSWLPKKYITKTENKKQEITKPSIGYFIRTVNNNCKFKNPKVVTGFTTNKKDLVTTYSHHKKNFKAAKNAIIEIQKVEYTVKETLSEKDINAISKEIQNEVVVAEKEYSELLEKYKDLECELQEIKNKIKQCFLVINKLKKDTEKK